MGKENEIMKNYSFVALIINIVAIVFHILPYLGLSAIGSTSTVIFLITVGIDLGLIYLTLEFINREDSIAQKIKKICWIYLLFALFAVMLLLGDSLIYSFSEAGDPIRTIMFILAQVAYYGLFGFGIFTAYYNLQNIDRPETWK